MQYQVIDTAEEGKVVGTYPTFRKAFNAARRHLGQDRMIGLDIKEGHAVMREQDIMHETTEGYWVARERQGYVVYRPNGTHSLSDSAYARTPDGLSIAIARCNYLAARTKRVT